VRRKEPRAREQRRELDVAAQGLAVIHLGRREGPDRVAALLPRALVTSSLLTLLSGCAGSSEEGASISVDGREFLPESVDGCTLAPGTQISLNFDVGLRAYAGCRPRRSV